MKQQVIVKTYKGSQESATNAFRKDAAIMGAQGYDPSSQTWAPGAYGCGSFLLALVLCVVVIGIIVFIYMLIVKPPGTLTVTYTLRESSARPQAAPPMLPPAPPDRRYYCYIDNQVQGPYDSQTLKQLYFSAQITDDTSCCLVGTEIWKSYKEIQF